MILLFATQENSKDGQEKCHYQCMEASSRWIEKQRRAREERHQAQLRADEERHQSQLRKQEEWCPQFKDQSRTDRLVEEDQWRQLDEWRQAGLLGHERFLHELEQSSQLSQDIPASFSSVDQDCSLPEMSEAISTWQEEEELCSQELEQSTVSRRFFVGAVHRQVAPAPTEEKYQHPQNRGPQMHRRRARTRDLSFGNFAGDGEASNSPSRARVQGGAAEYRPLLPLRC